jgi:hypothetical protein
MVCWEGWVSGRAYGGIEGPERSGPPALIEVFVRDRFGLSGIEFGGLVEVVREGFLGDLFWFPIAGPHGSHGEFSQGWSPGRMEERG